MLFPTFNTRSKTVLTTVIIGLIGYVFYRAYFLSFTHDECLSYSIICGDQYQAKTANNHFLNTVFMHITNALWGNSEFSLRLPNALAFLLYLFFSLRLLRAASQKWLLFCLGFSLLLFNTFVLDFFSLARGYGLSLSFALGGFYFITKPIPDNSSDSLFNKTLNKDILYSVLLAFFASLANLAMINFLITVLLIGGIKHVWYATERLLRWQYIVVAIATVIMLAVNINPLLYLKEAKQLYHGTASLNEAFTSVVEHCFYFSPYDYIAENLFKVVCVIFWLLGITLTFLTKGRSTQLLISSAVFIILLLGIISENLLFEAKYPADRTTLIFIITGSMLIYHTLLALYDYSKTGRGVANCLALTISVMMGYHFSVNANLEYSQVWRYDYGGKHVMQHIQQLTKNHQEEVTIRYYWAFKPSIQYYKERYALNLNLVEDAPDNQTTFIYTWKNADPIPNYTAIQIFPTNNNTLFIRNDKIDQFYPVCKIYR